MVTHAPACHHPKLLDYLNKTKEWWYQHNKLNSQIVRGPDKELSHYTGVVIPMGGQYLHTKESNNSLTFFIAFSNSKGAVGDLHSKHISRKVEENKCTTSLSIFSG